MSSNPFLDLLAEVRDSAQSEVPAVKAEPKDIRVTYEDFDFDKLHVYAGLDCIGTSAILDRIMPKLVARDEVLVSNVGENARRERVPSILSSFHSIEIPSQEFIIDLEINGMGYSPERNRILNDRMDAQVAELDELIFTQIGEKVDLNSGPAVAEFLYNKRGFIPPNFTKAGEPATDGMALMVLAGLDPLGNKYATKNPDLQYLAHMAKRRDIFSACNTFVRTYVRDFVKRDGRIHPSYNQFGTSSFRITGSDPNLTQLPRAKHGYNIRTCYTVRPGFVFISFDFSSAEVKVLANISKEPAMMRAIADGLDFHTFSASEMKGIPYAEIAAILKDDAHPLFKEYKGLRQLSKVLTFSILYGSSIAGIAAQLNLELSKAEELINLYFNTFPKVREYIENSHRFAINNQFVITPLGQRKREFGTYKCFKGTAAYNAALRNAQNVIIQSTTSSIGLVTFAELNERIKPYGAMSICTVYDSIEIECPIETAAKVIDICYDTLDNYPLEVFKFLELPIGCEGDVGISWGETKVVHPGVSQEEILAEIAKIRQQSAASFGASI